MIKEFKDRGFVRWNQSVPEHGLILLGGKNCTDSWTNGHGNGEGTIEFGGNILVHASSVMT